MRDGATAGFKYFAFDGTEAMIRVMTGGSAEGELLVSDTPDFARVLTHISVSTKGPAAEARGPFFVEKGVRPLYFRFDGEGALDFISFTIR